MFCFVVVFLHLYCSAQLSMFSIEKRCRNKIIIIILLFYVPPSFSYIRISFQTVLLFYCCFNETVYPPGFFSFEWPFVFIEQLCLNH